MIDYIPMVINHEYLSGFSEGLQERLISSLGLLGKDSLENCAAYISDDNRIKSEKVELQARKSVLVAARKQLAEFAL